MCLEMQTSDQGNNFRILSFIWIEFIAASEVTGYNEKLKQTGEISLKQTINETFILSRCLRCMIKYLRDNDMTCNDKTISRKTRS